MTLFAKRRTGPKPSGKSRPGLPDGPVSSLPLPESFRRPPPVPQVSANGVEWLPVPAWEQIPWLWHGFSTRRGGVSRAYCAEEAPGELNLGFTPDDDRANVLRNRDLARRGRHRQIEPLRWPCCARFTRMCWSSAAPRSCGEGKTLGKGDGLMTDRPGVLLGSRRPTAFRFWWPIAKRRAVAAFHAGWRGTVKRIVENGIGRMRLEFGSRPEDLVAAIGPGILGLLLRGRRRSVFRVRIPVHLWRRAVSRGLRHRSGANQISDAVSHAAGSGPFADRAQPACGPGRSQPPAVPRRRPAVRTRSRWSAPAPIATRSCSFPTAARTAAAGGC